MKVGLFLMTKKGFRVLESLLDENHVGIIDFVCIGRDSKIDNDFSTEIENLCKQKNVNYLYRESFKSSDFKSNYHIAIGWKWMLELEQLIILHDSILPKYRGFAPLVNMLINGENELGVTAIFASNEYDKGDIILQEKISVTYPIKIQQAIDKTSELYSKIVLKLIELMKQDSLKSEVQNEKLATYSLWLDDDDYFIDWSWSSEKIARKVDACGKPYAGAKCKILNQIIQISEVEVVDDVFVENRTPGKIIFFKEDKPVIVCGSGLLMIKVAMYVHNNQSIFPLQKFRIKFN